MRSRKAIRSTSLKKSFGKAGKVFPPLMLLYIVPFIPDPQTGSTKKVAFVQCMEARCCALVYGVVLDMLLSL